MNVIDWLLDSDPSIRWQVMRDLTDAPPEAFARERSRVALEGWGAQLLQAQPPDGLWGGGPCHPAWTSTKHTLVLLRDLGLDPASEQAQRAIGLVRDNVRWEPEFNSAPFFDGEVEACINGRVLAVGAYFGVVSDALADRLIREQLEDGGWNCNAPPSTRSSFHSTICVLEGLLEYEKARGASPALSNARQRGQDYLLKRRLFRRLSTGDVIDSAWTQFSFPTHWHYDVLWGLDYLRRAGVSYDERMAEAVDLVESKRDASGRCLLENAHPGKVYVDIEEPGKPSRWITLRALRVLRWFRPNA